MADILDRLAEVLSEQGLDDNKIMYIESKLRHEYSGERHYVTKKSQHRESLILEQMRRSRDFQRIAKEFQVSVCTIYRLSHKSRKKNDIHGR